VLNFEKILKIVSLKTKNLKVSKSQKHFFLKLHCPKNERNIRQNSALESRDWLNWKNNGLLCTNYVK
jgi:hypothetical protein